MPESSLSISIGLRHWNRCLWRKLDRLYLLSPDPVANLSRLEMINRCMSAIPARRRVPLIVRIDDPWQAEAWRARQFGGSDSRWAADAVGKYEVTARRLLEEVTADPTVTRIVVCGSSPLTLALCADIAQRHRERSYRANPEDAGLPTLTLVDDNAEEYLRDHEFHENQLGLGASRPDIAVVLQRPSVPVLTDLVDADADSQVVILVDSAAAAADTMMGTRLAARFPAMLIYAWDPNARHQEDRALLWVGCAPLASGWICQPVWRRIPGSGSEAHPRALRRQVRRRDRPPDPATLPWAVLDEFHRESNRRQVRNILWIVEAMGGHSWNSAASQAAPPPESDMYQRSGATETLRLLGFDADSAIAMARAEHQDWCRFYREAGWRYGPTRDDERRIHDKLLDWDAAEHTRPSRRPRCRAWPTHCWSLRSWATGPGQYGSGIDGPGRLSLSNRTTHGRGLPRQGTLCTETPATGQFTTARGRPGRCATASFGLPTSMSAGIAGGEPFRQGRPARAGRTSTPSRVLRLPLMATGSWQVSKANSGPFRVNSSGNVMRAAAVVNEDFRFRPQPGIGWREGGSTTGMVRRGNNPGRFAGQRLRASEWQMSDWQMSVMPRTR